MKRIVGLAIGLAALLLMGVAAAKPATITMWLGHLSQNQVADFNRTVVQPFNASQDKYQVKAVVMQDLERQLKLALSAHKGPDIVSTPGPTYLVNYIKNHLVIPLDSYAEQYHWNKLFNPSMLDLQRLNGHLYGLPSEYESMFLFYNKTLFTKEGWQPPKTLADLEAIVKAAKAQRITPFAAGAADWKPTDEWFVTVVLNHYAGPENLYKALTGKMPWTSPVFVNAIKLLNDWWQKGWFSKDYYALTGLQAVNKLATGQAAMVITGSWGVARMRQTFSKSGQEWDWAPFPSLSNAAPYPLFELGIGGTESINAFSKHPDGVAEFLNYMFQPSTFLKWTAAQPGTGLLFPPENTTASDLKGLDLNPKLSRQILEVGGAIKKGNFGYTTWTFWPDRTDQYIIDGMEKVWAGQITPAEFMKNVNEQFQQDLKDGRVPPIAAPQASK